MTQNTANAVVQTIANSEILEVVQFLGELGLPALPVAPAQDPYQDGYHKVVSGDRVKVWKHCPLTEDFKPKPFYTGKNPSLLRANGAAQIIKHEDYQGRLPNAHEIEIWWENPLNGIGTLGGWGGYVWLDFDVKQFDSQDECDRAFYGLLEAYPQLLESWWEQTHSGGYRLAVKVKEAPTFTNFALEPGGKHRGEALGKGRFTVLAPTVGVSGQPYRCMNRAIPVEIESLESIGIFPTKVAREQRAPRPQRPALATAGTIALDQLGRDGTAGAALRGDNFKGDRSATLTTAYREWCGWVNWAADNGIAVSGSADDLAHQAGESLGIDADRVDRIIKSVSPADCDPAALHHGGDEPCWKKIERLDRATFEAVAPDSVKASLGYYAQSAKPKNDADSGKSAQSDDEKICQLAKQFAAIETAWGDSLRFNQLTKRVEFEAEPINLDRVYLKLAREHNIQAGRSTAADIVVELADRNAYHPVAEYLRRVHQLYKPDTSILENVADRYFGTSNPLYNAYIKRTMIGAVARVMAPGCKMDTALILQGLQGFNKSTFFKVLAGEQWFDDSLGNPSDKDERLKLHSAWVVEWAELDAIFKRKDISQTKAFLSCSVDNLRVPYGRSIEAFPRHSIVVGTANPSELLSDPTGSRRFWCIPVKQKIDVELLSQERDQLWSAAVELYMRGEQWHLTELESAASEKANQDFEAADSWEGYIRQYLQHQDWATTAAVLEGALQIEPSRQDRASQMRVADILKRMGWTQKTKTIGGDRVRGWELTQPTQPLNEVVSEVVRAEAYTEQRFQPSTQPDTTYLGKKINPEILQTEEVEGVERSAVENERDRKVCKKVVSGCVTPETHTQRVVEGNTTSDTTSVVVSIPLKIGDRVHYVGSDGATKKVCQGKTLTIEAIDSEGIATVSHDRWVVSNCCHVSQLKMAGDRLAMMELRRMFPQEVLEQAAGEMRATKKATQR